MSWSRWNWLDDGLLPLAVAVLRTCWLWPWLALLQRWLASSYQGNLLPVGSVLGLLLGGTVAARWALTLSAKQARTAVAGVGLMVIFLVLWWRLYQAQYALWNVRWVSRWGTEMVTWTDWESRGVPPPFFALLATAYLWLRGMLDGGRLSLMREHVWRTFAVGFVALVLLLMFAALDGRGLPQGTGNLLWLFFATAMAALALTGLKAAGGLERISGPEGREIDVQVQFDRYWLGSVVSVIGGLLGVGLVLSALIAPETVAQALSAVWDVARQGLLYVWLAISLILLPIAYLLALFLRPLVHRLTAFLEEFWGTEPLSAPEFPKGLRPEDLPEGGTVLDRVPGELRWVALALLIVLIGLIFALALRRLLSGSRIKNGILETRETVLSRDLLQEQLARLWSAWLSRLQRQSKIPFNPFLSLGGELDTRRRIRAVYQAVLAAAQGRGRPRARGQTPIEYRFDLAEVWPDSWDALDVITDAYLEARYAPDPPTPERAERVSSEWERLQTSLQAQE